MAFAHKLRCSARGDDRLFDGQSVIGFVGINLARRIRDDRRSDRDIGLIGRSRLDVADDAGILVGGNVGLVAMRGRPRAVPDPGGLFVAFAGEPITVASMSVPLRTAAPFDSRSREIASNRPRSRPCSTSWRRKRTKAVRSGVSSSRAKPQKRRKLARSESASANPTSERSYHREQERLEHRQRRPGLLAFCGRIERRQNKIRLRPIDQGGTSGLVWRSALAPNRNASCPIRRRAMTPSKSRWANGIMDRTPPQAPASTCA
jgi:hypothetical protein